MNCSQLSVALPANVVLMSDQFSEFVFDTNSFDAHVQAGESMFPQSNIVQDESVKIFSFHQITKCSLLPTYYPSKPEQAICCFEVATIWLHNYVMSLQQHYSYPQKDFHLRHSLEQLLVAGYYKVVSSDECRQNQANFLAQQFAPISGTLLHAHILESRDYVQARQILATFAPHFNLFAQKMICELQKSKIVSEKFGNQKLPMVAIREENVIPSVNNLLLLLSKFMYFNMIKYQYI